VFAAPAAPEFYTLEQTLAVPAARPGGALAAATHAVAAPGSGRLRICSSEPRPLGLSYDLFHPSARSRRGVEGVFMDWMTGQVAQSMARFEGLRCGPVERRQA
jgi:hypothetical protein